MLYPKMRFFFGQVELFYRKECFFGAPDAWSLSLSRIFRQNAALMNLSMFLCMQSDK